MPKTPVRYRKVTPKRPLTETEMAKLDSEADRWVNHDVPLVSIKWNKAPCKGAWKKRKNGQLGHFYENITRDILNYDATGIGLICVPTSGIVGVGCDDMKGAQHLDEDLRSVGITPVSYTSSKGIHFLFKYDSRLPHTCGTILHRYGEVDIRNDDKGYLVLPGSLHDTGVFYHWVNLPKRTHTYIAAHELKEHWSFPEVPEWLVQSIDQGYKKENSGTISERRELKNKEKDCDWGKPVVERNNQPVYNTGEPLPPKMIVGSYAKLLRMLLPRGRWSKFSKHNAAIKWIMTGVAIEEGERFKAERSIGSLAATCYAHKDVAVKALELFRFVYIPVRRSREEEIQLNRDIEKLCSKRYREQKNRNYNTDAPDRKMFPQENGRYWHNVNARSNSMQPLIDDFVENKLFHRLYEDRVSASNFVDFLRVHFRSHLIYECVQGNSRLHAILNHSLGIPSTTTPGKPKPTTVKEWLGEDKKFKNLNDLLSMDVGGKLSQKEKDLRSEAKLYERDRMLAKRKDKAEASKNIPVHSIPLLAPGIMKSYYTPDYTCRDTEKPRSAYLIKSLAFKGMPVLPYERATSTSAVPVRL